MTRYLKVVGLALVAVFAFSAMTAAGASAQSTGVLTAEESFWLHGDDEPGEPGTNALTAFGGRTECAKATYTGGKVEGTDPETGHHEALSSGAGSFTLSPDYSGCTSASGLPETVTMNGCDYVINIGETITAEDPLYEATADLVCPEGQEVTIDIYGNETAHELGSVLCTIHIPPTTKSIPGGTLTEEENETLTLGGEFTPFPVTLTGPSACAEETVTDPEAILDIEATIEGQDAPTGEGKNVPLTVTH